MPEKPGWLISVVGLLLYVAMWLLTDFVVHSAKWAHGDAPHRLSVMLPAAVVSGLFFALANYLRKRWQQRTRSA